MLPLAKFALEAHALGNPEAGDYASLDFLAGGLPALFAGFTDTPFGTDKAGDKSFAFDGVSIEAGSAAFRESVCSAVSDQTRAARFVS